MDILCEIVPHGGEEYRALVELRRRVLRLPLGLDFTEGELKTEAPYLHVAARYGDGVDRSCFNSPHEGESARLLSSRWGVLLLFLSPHRIASSIALALHSIKNGFTVFSSIPLMGGVKTQRIIGTLQAVDLDSGKWKIRQVAVAPEMQGKGVGRAMNDFIEAELRGRGATQITLNARETAIPFYERMGYRAVGDIFEEIGLPHQRMEKKVL